MTSRLRELQDAGFDQSRRNYSTKGWTVRCSQCEALVICGHPTHERGCPNAPKDEQEENDGE